MTINDSNVTIMVKDIDLAISFYQSIGFTVKNRWGNYYAQISAPGITIGLHPSKGTPNTSENISIGFIVDDLSEAKKRLEELKIGHEERTEEGGNFIHFKDSDGTPLYFINPKR